MLLGVRIPNNTWKIVAVIVLNALHLLSNLTGRAMSKFVVNMLLQV